MVQSQRELLEELLNVKFDALKDHIAFGDNTIAQKVEFIKENLGELTEQIQKVVLDNHENRLRSLEINGSPETSRRVVDFEERLRNLEGQPPINKDIEDRMREVERWKNAVPPTLIIAVVSIAITIIGTVTKFHL